MRTTLQLIALMALTGGLLLSAAAPAAEITALSAEATVSVTPVTSGTPGETVTATEILGTNVASLPLQPVAQHVAVGEEAAASVAGQVADPTTVTTANPEDLSINFALSSIDEAIAHRGQATLTETRTIVLDPNDLGGELPGTQVELIGTFFIDGALAILTENAGQDLTGTEIMVSVTITAASGDADPNEVFAGTITYTGTTGADATRTITGDLTALTTLDTQFALETPWFDTVNTLLIIASGVDYRFPAVVGEDVVLSITIELDCHNTPGGTAVAGILGTPLDTIVDVLSLVQDSLAAQEVQSKLLAARADANAAALTAADTEPCGCCPMVGFGTLAVALTLTVTGWVRRRPL